MVGIWAALLLPPHASDFPTDPPVSVRTAQQPVIGSVGAVLDGGEAATALATESDDEPGFRVVVSLSERKLYVRDGDRTLGTYPIAIGQAKHPTPKGSYKIRRVIWNPRWVPPKVSWAKNKSAKAPGDPRTRWGR